MCQGLVTLKQHYGKIDFSNKVGLAELIRCGETSVVNTLDLDSKIMNLLFGPKDVYAIADPTTNKVIAVIKRDGTIDQNQLQAGIKYSLFSFAKTTLKIKQDDR